MNASELRRIALEEQKKKEAERLKFHKYVYEKMLSQEKDNIIKKAEKYINKWEEKGTCSRFYIDTWRNLINSELNYYYDEIIANKNGNSLALMQNSPFVFLLREYESKLF